MSSNIVTQKARGAARRLRKRLRGQAQPAKRPSPHSLAANREFVVEGLPGEILSISGAPLPVLEVDGWCGGMTLPDMSLELSNGRTIYPRVSRTYRPDLAPVPEISTFAGFTAFFQLEGAKPKMLKVGEKLIKVTNPADYSTFEPHYGTLLNTTHVAHRSEIYGQGPTAPSTPEILAMCESVSGKVLDFGCGNGDLVRWLKSRGHDACGIELDTERIRVDILAEVADRITLYDGAAPLPYADDEFDTIIATEVIEHIPTYEQFIPEFARILRPGGRLYVTVPDISSIPLSSITGTVPWHLLEATHFNFFTHESMDATMVPFEIEQRFQLCSVEVSGRRIPGSLGAIYRLS